jgi:hypothetical protein
MVAEAYGIEIPGRQQSQGQNLVALDGFPLGVLINEAQVFQTLAPLRESGGIQDQAVFPGGFGPLKPPPQKGQEAPVKRPPTPFRFLEAVEGIFLSLEQGVERSLPQVMDGLDLQEHQVGEDEQEMPGSEAFVLADTGSGQMTLDMQHGKQFLDPQFQVSPKIFQGRFDLPLKASDFPVMQKKAPFSVVLLTISQS